MEPKHRISITNSEKQALCQHHLKNQHISQRDLCHWFTEAFHKPIKQSTICLILKSKERYLASTRPHERKQRSTQWPDLEKALAQWHIVAQHSIPITGEVLKAYATELWKKLPQYKDQEVPTWSDGWLASFKRRHNIRQQTVYGEAASVDTTEPKFMAAIAELQAILASYSTEDQYNCDETGLFWKALPDRSLTSEVLSGRKQEKHRFTLLNCCNKTGNHKLPLWIIGKHKNPRCFNAAGVNIERLDCQYRANRKAWMTGSIFIDWLRWFDNQMNGRKVILIMDNFSAHKVAVQELEGLPESFRLRNTTIAWLPPNSTSKTQPLDQGIIASFKAHYKKQWLQFLLDEYSIGRPPLGSMHILRAIRWSIRAWNEVSSQTINSCWMHSYLNPMTSQMRTSSQATFTNSQDQRVVQEIQGQINTLQQQQQIYEAMNIYNFINQPEETIEDSMQDLTTHIASIYEQVEEEEEDTEPVEVLPKVTAAQALQMIQNLRLHEEQSDDCNNNWIHQLDQYEKVLKVREMKGLTQSQLDGWLVQNT